MGKARKSGVWRENSVPFFFTVLSGWLSTTLRAVAWCVCVCTRESHWIKIFTKNARVLEYLSLLYIDIGEANKYPLPLPLPACNSQVIDEIYRNYLRSHTQVLAEIN